MISEAVFMLVFVFIVELTTGKLENDVSYYCSDKLTCRDLNNNPVKHVMCVNGLKFGSKCRNASNIPITDEIRELFLNGHNEKRSFVAQGKLDGVFSNRAAVRMATFVWDDELEMIALANVLQCKMEHDKCHQTERYRFTGQNLYSQWTSDAHSMTDQYIKGAVKQSMKSWFNEYKFVNDFKWIESFGNNNEPWWKIGHFTQMIWSNTSAIGCAIVKDQGDIYIACNYADGNMQSSSVYEVGRMGSKCQTTLNSIYPGLCSESKFYMNHINVAPTVTKWIRNGKKVDGDNNSSVCNKYVKFTGHILILALHLVIANMLIV